MPRRNSASASPRSLRLLHVLCVTWFLFLLNGCGGQNNSDPSSLIFLIESNPTNNDPDVFEFVFSSKRFPPDGANRGHYRNPRVDALVDQIRIETDREKRKALCSEAHKILAVDLPYLPLWFVDVVSVHRRTLGDLELSPTGDYDFLGATAAPGAH